MTTTSLAATTLALALAPAAALAAPPQVSDVRIDLVDSLGVPVSGVDVLVADASGPLSAEFVTDGSVSTVAAGEVVEITLPGLGTTHTVALDEVFGTSITLELGSLKTGSAVTTVKALPVGSPQPQYTGVVLVNDDCADAIPITDGDTSFTTIGATTDGTLGTNNDDIWYLYTASCSGVATFSTCNQADFDTDLALLTADSTCGSQTALAINDDAAGCAGNTTILNAPVEAGVTYLLSVGAFAAGQQGSGVLSVSCAAAAPNDLCENAVPIAVGSSTTFDNSANTNSPSDPLFSCIFAGEGFGSTWFSIVPDTTAIFLDTSASTGSTDTVVAVYSGGCDGLVEIGCNDDIDFGAANFLSQVLVTGLTPGEEYLIRVSTFSETSAGSITLDVSDAGGLQVCNGSGVNTATLSSDDSIVIGEDFTVTAAPAGSGLLAISLDEDQVLTPQGELLLDRSSALFLPSADGVYTIGVPDDAGLVGLTVYLQAVAGDGTLTNALKGDVEE